MSLLWILFIIVVIWLVFKIGLQAFKWFLILAAVVVGYWFLTSGGGFEIKKPSNMPSFTNPIK